MVGRDGGNGTHRSGPIAVTLSAWAQGQSRSTGGLCSSQFDFPARFSIVWVCWTVPAFSVLVSLASSVPFRTSLCAFCLDSTVSIHTRDKEAAIGLAGLLSTPLRFWPGFRFLLCLFCADGARIPVSFRFFGRRNDFCLEPYLNPDLNPDHSLGARKMRKMSLLSMSMSAK